MTAGTESTELTAPATDGTQTVVDTAVRSVEPHELNPANVYAVAVPAGGDVRVLDLESQFERRLDAPRRKRGTVSLTTAPSLAQYIAHHDADDERTYLFADAKAARVVAIFNGPNAEPGWADHRAVLTLTKRPEWQRWLSRDAVLGNQVEFAEHIEDCLADIVEPPGADLLELAQTFEAATSVEFRSGSRLQDGQRQLTYVEEIDAKAGATGQIVVPKEFVLSIAPFEGSDLVQVTARLRYRVAGGRLAIGYILHRPDVVEREAFDSVLATVEEASELTALHGAAWT